MRLAFMTAAPAAAAAVAAVAAAVAAKHLLNLAVSQKLLTLRQQEHSHLQDTIIRWQRFFHHQIRLQGIRRPTLLPRQSSGQFLLKERFYFEEHWRLPSISLDDLKEEGAALHGLWVASVGVFLEEARSGSIASFSRDGVEQGAVFGRAHGFLL
jgi:hypothetical protein